MQTFVRLSGGRVEVRTRFTLRCDECGTEYHPRVEARMERVIALALLAIGLVVVAGALVLAGRADRVWFLGAKVAAAVIVLVLATIASRFQRRLSEPRFYVPTPVRAPAYGEIVLGCPRCGSPRASLPEERTRST